MRPLSFPVAAKRLLDFARALPDTEENLKEFYEISCHLIYRTDSMCDRWPEDNKPGHKEWCEFRAILSVSWAMYWDSIWTDGRDPKIYFPRTRDVYRPDLKKVLEYLREIVGEIPRKGEERWLAGVEDRCRRLTEKVTSLAEFKEKMDPLLDGGNRYLDIYNRILAEYKASGKI